MQLLRGALLAEHKPTTVLQTIALEAMVLCILRCRRAAKVETQYLQPLLTDIEVQSEEPTTIRETPRWYLAGRQDLRSAIRLLLELKQDFECTHRIDARWKEPLDQCFGPPCYTSLTEWNASSPDALMLVNHLEKHAQLYGGDFPPPSKEPMAEVVQDPQQRLQMTGKLIDQKLQHLRDLIDSRERRESQSGAQGVTAAEFAGRYFSAATRDLHRAVEWFSYLRENNL